MTTLNPDFRHPVVELGKHISGSMASLYDFQSALIDANGNTHDVKNLFWKLRSRLKPEWEEIRAFLQKCHWFGKDVLVLKSSLETESQGDCIEFLRDMGRASVELYDKSTRLLRVAQDTSDQFVTMTMDYEKILRDYNSRSGKFLRTTQPNNGFVESEEDGYQALLEARRYLSEVVANLADIKEFWKITSRTCQTFVLKGAIKVGSRQAESLGTLWNGYQDALLRTIESIAKTCDAIMVNATGSASQRPANIPLPPNKVADDPLSPPASSANPPNKGIIAEVFDTQLGPIMTFCGSFAATAVIASWAIGRHL